LMQPDDVLGVVLNPFISLSVAIILFEGGLSLRISDLKYTGRSIRNLILFGSLISWVLIALLAFLVLGFDLRLSLLLGAILLVSGPTVVTPMLRQIKLKHSLSSILRWEGIIIDPIGASLAVLIFETILSQTAGNPFGTGAVIVIATLLNGLIIGSLGAIFMIIAFKKRLIGDYLQESFTLIMVLATYAIADMIQSESGLLVVTIMGIILANQQYVVIRHIISFKENITVLLISSLFVILAARVEMAELVSVFNIKTAIFLALLIVLVRPLTVFLSTIKSGISVKEKIFLSSLYPRGIVAAAVASIFAIRLDTVGYPQADQIIPITFLTIIVTVFFYGLMGKPLVKLLNLRRDQKGLIIVGAHQFARLLAKTLELANIPILLIDTNIENVIAAKEMGLVTKHSSILSKKIKDEVEMSSYGKILSLTSSDETNLLASIEYMHVISPLNIFRLYPKDRKKDLFTKSNNGFFFVSKGTTSSFLDSKILAGASLKPSTLTEEFTFEDFQNAFPDAILLALISKKGSLLFFYEGHGIKPSPGSILISLRQ